jgi:hypothetical protein
MTKINDAEQDGEKFSRRCDGGTYQGRIPSNGQKYKDLPNGYYSI